MATNVAGIAIPDSRVAREAAEFIRDCEPELIFNHSMRVFLFGAIMGRNKGVSFDNDMLYVAALFHDLGLMETHTSKDLRFEVDGANAARDFLLARDVSRANADIVWEAIALHTTPGIAEHMRPEIALCRAGVRMDVVGTAYEAYTDEQRAAVVAAFPRPGFKRGFIDAQARNARSKPQTTFGTINFDYLEWTGSGIVRVSQCDHIMNAPWSD